MSENILKPQRSLAVVACEPLAGGRIKLARSVPNCRFFLRRSEALALCRVQMQQFRPAHIFQLPKHTYNLTHIVPVERSEIADIHSLKDILLMTDGRLDGVIQPQDSFLPTLAQIAPAV